MIRDENSTMNDKNYNDAQRARGRVRRRRIAAAAVAAAFLAIGIFRQEYLGVFNKAVMICFECIGIG